MKLLAALLFCGCLYAQQGAWESLERSLGGQRIEVARRDGRSIRGEFVAAHPDSIVVRASQGEQSIPRASVRQIGLRDSSRRTRNGLIGLAAGLGAGIAIGWAVCPSCANEGSPGKYIGPGAGIGADIGALGFLSPGYRTVYRVK